MILAYFEEDSSPPYVDVQSVYEEPTFPKMYEEPADPVMPSSLDKYLINKADIGEKVDATEIEGALDHYGEYQKVMELPDSDWGEAEREPEKYIQNDKAKYWSKNVLKILDLDPHDRFSYQELDYWRQVAGIKNISSRGDSDKIKQAYRDHDGILPRPPEGYEKTKDKDDSDKKKGSNYLKYWDQAEKLIKKYGKKPRDFKGSSNWNKKSELKDLKKKLRGG